MWIYSLTLSSIIDPWALGNTPLPPWCWEAQSPTGLLWSHVSNPPFPEPDLWLCVQPTSLRDEVMCALGLVLQMSQTPGWDHYLGMNTSCQICVLAVARPTPFSNTVTFPVDGPGRFLCHALWLNTRGRTPAMWPTWLRTGELGVLLGFSFPTRGPEAQGDSLSIGLRWPGRQVNMELLSYLPKRSVLASLVQRVLLPQSSVVGFSQFLVRGQLLVIPVRSHQGQPVTITILMESPPILFITAKDQFWSMVISVLTLFSHICIITLFRLFVFIFFLAFKCGNSSF